MSNLTPAGLDYMNYETSRMARNDRERELATYRPGDKNIWMFNTSAMTRMAQSSKASKPGDSLLTDSEKTKTKRKRIYGMGKSTGEEKSGTVKKPTLGGE